MAHRMGSGSAHDPRQHHHPPPVPRTPPPISTSLPPTSPPPPAPFSTAPALQAPSPRLYTVPPPALPPSLPPPPPPPSMQSTYPSYHPPSSGPGGDPHHAPPSGPGLGLGAPLHTHSQHTSPLPSINLPPIRSIDAPPQLPALAPGPSRYPSHRPSQHQQPPPPQYAQHSYYPPSPLPPLPQQQQQHPTYGSPAQQSPRAFYQLPPPEPQQRLMSGGRHKKEIKRRTKTGCLTCRKRRIKCDEAHPTCRNCEKSKRECLGYDPIFKQQSSPVQLQPAPIPASQTGLGIMHASQAPQAQQTSFLDRQGNVVSVVGPPAPSGSAGMASGYASSSYGMIDPTLGPGAEGGPPRTAQGQTSPLEERGRSYQPAYESAYSRG